MQRKLRGPMAGWDLNAQLLRLIELDLRGLQYQNAGGKGQKPKPIPLPEKQGKKADGAELAQRLKNLGMLPPGTKI